MLDSQMPVNSQRDGADSENEEVAVDLAEPGADKTVTTTKKEKKVKVSEAKGSETSEAAEANTSEDKESDAAPAESEELSEEVIEAVVEEVLPLTVTLTFGEEVVKLEVTENFQLDLRQACKDQDSRFDEFEVDGEVSPVNLRLLLNALK